jgi:tetratricopeptide (TPR) repeat protein
MKIVAIIACIIVYVVYIIISDLAGWKYGGGTLVILALIGIMRAIWKAANNVGEKRQSEVPTSAESTSEVSVDMAVCNEENSMASIREGVPEVETTILPKEEVEYDELPPIPQDESIGDETPIECKGIVNSDIPSSPTSHWGKFRLYYILSGIFCITASVVIPAIIHFNKEKQAERERLQKEQEISSLIQKSSDAFNKSFYDLSLKYIKEAEKLDSNHIAINYCAGRIYYELKNYLEAEKYFKNAYTLNLNKQDFIAFGTDTIKYHRMLYLYCEALSKCNSMDKKRESIVIAQEYLMMYPDDPDAYRSIIISYYQTDQTTKAKSWAEKMLTKFPEHADSYHLFAYVLADLKKYKGDNIEKYKEAIVYYKKCIELKPSYALAYNNLGLCYSYTGQYQKAYECWRKAVDLGENVYALNNLKRHGQAY